MMPPDGRPPDPDVLEITVFGPGYGESAVLHLGDGTWGIVDSCFGVWSKDVPAALWYLDFLGVDVGSQVSFVCATHWHDDHIAGLSSVVQACTNAKLYASSAMASEEMIALARLQDNSVLDGYGIKEFNALLKTCRSLGRKIHRVAQDTVLEAFVIGSEPGQVQALSPSSQSVELAIAALAKRIPEAGRPQLNVAATGPNHHSVVTLVTSPHTTALLGSDLEVTSDEDTGWAALLKHSICFQGKLASYFKVSHHGSQNGHCDALWGTRLAQPNPSVCVTPWCLMDGYLPTLEDVKRITSLTNRAYVTGHPRSKSAAKTMPATVRRELNERRLPLHFAPHATGYVRARWDTTQSREWAVDCFNEAGKLEDIQLPGRAC